MSWPRCEIFSSKKQIGSFINWNRFASSVYHILLHFATLYCNQHIFHRAWKLYIFTLPSPEEHEILDTLLLVFMLVVAEQFSLTRVSRGNIKRCGECKGLTTCLLEQHKTQSYLALTYLYQAKPLCLREDRIPPPRTTYQLLYQ